MQQQSADYDLLAVFPDEAQAKTAVNKLQQAGYTNEEIFQLAAGSVGSGEFREHGPNRARSDIFLQTTRTRPSALLVILFAIAFGILFGGLGFVLALIVVIALLHSLVILEPITAIGAAVIGLIIGTATAIQRGTRVRGDIGQNRAASTRTPTPPPVPVPVPAPSSGAKTIVALRFPASDNINRRQSQARAILIQNQGKIDRSVGRSE